MSEYGEVFKLLQTSRISPAQDWGSGSRPTAERAREPPLLVTIGGAITDDPLKAWMIIELGPRAAPSEASQRDLHKDPESVLEQGHILVSAKRLRVTIDQSYAG